MLQSYHGEMNLLNVSGSIKNIKKEFIKVKYLIINISFILLANLIYSIVVQRYSDEFRDATSRTVQIILMIMVIIGATYPETDGVSVLKLFFVVAILILFAKLSLAFKVRFGNSNNLSIENKKIIHVFISSFFIILTVSYLISKEITDNELVINLGILLILLIILLATIMTVLLSLGFNPFKIFPTNNSYFYSTIIILSSFLYEMYMHVNLLQYDLMSLILKYDIDILLGKKILDLIIVSNYLFKNMWLYFILIMLLVIFIFTDMTTAVIMNNMDDFIERKNILSDKKFNKWNYNIFRIAVIFSFSYSFIELKYLSQSESNSLLTITPEGLDSFEFLATVFILPLILSQIKTFLRFIRPYFVIE